MASNEDIPPLEDMSDVLEHVKAMKEIQEERTRGQSKPSTTNDTCHEIYNRKKNVVDSSAANTQKTVSADKAKSETVQTEKKKDGGGFGGMKKGFLFGSSKPAPVKQDTGARSKVFASGEKKKTTLEDIPVKQDTGARSKVFASGEKKKTTLEDIPFVQKRDKSETLKLEEVQETMNKTSENLLKKQDWITDDLMGTLENNQTVFKGFQNQEYIRIIGEFQRDPQGAMEKYKDHENFQEFFREFCKLMGNHFTGLGSTEQAQSSEQVSGNTSQSPKISVVPESESAQMSVRSSTNPHQPTAEDERKMQDILSDPEIRTVLSDPKIAQLFEVARKSPEAAQRLVHNGDDDFKRKIQKLVRAGLLQFQV